MESPLHLSIATDAIPPDMRPGNLCGLSLHSTWAPTTSPAAYLIM